ncbi:hypothetical protein PR202_ga11753 [Eleusine coracana subsp. coracana]|uniref:CSC1-like protein RXW8 n=1 Tax=Eleusine coracana subsp. coracana TaxID=191504 RepID=A0AAV5CAE9_ELECO|nr:hypothetical protein PR202_ga11753 [Eleusine coracana subsp. coracana]
MKLSSLLTSAGINIGLCVLFLSLYSVLRKQPANVRVYFGRRIAEEHDRLRGAFILDRFVPSTGWIVKALRCTEDEILAAAGLDAVVFNRILIFSIRIFSLAALLCFFGVLPLNYFGQDMKHVRIPLESLDIFTIGNVVVESRWLWVHCVALYIISGAACILLYISGAKKAYRKFKDLKDNTVDQGCRSLTYRCCLCGASSKSFELLSTECEQDGGKGDSDSSLNLQDEECTAAFVFFKTRYAALVASEILQTSNPMKWVTNLAPDPDDVYWSNLWLPYKQLWVRRIATLLGSIVFMFLFLIPVTFIQGLTQLEQLQQKLPFLKGILNTLQRCCFNMLIFLLVLFQLLNVYRTRYDTGGLYWPIAHNTIIFSLVLTQIICLGVFGLKESPITAGFTIPLIILTLLFNQYCRNRLLPLFKTFPAQDLIDMDREDERSGRINEIHHRLHFAYCQFPDTDDVPLEKIRIVGGVEEPGSSSGEGESNGKEACENPIRDLSHPTLQGLPISRMRHAVRSITFLIRLQKRGLSK